MSPQNPSSPIRIAVFASGRGSNFQAVDRVLRALPQPPAEIVLCISNNPNPGAFEYAKEQGIRTMRLSERMFDTGEAYADAVVAALDEAGVELILLAGFMKLLPESVVRRWNGRILNVHPALLPDFGGKGMYGRHVHEAVIASGRPESGATVHVVDEEYDRGMIVASERVPVLPEDTPETLAARVLEAEHRLFPEVVMEAAKRLAAGGTIEPMNGFGR